MFIEKNQTTTIYVTRVNQDCLENVFGIARMQNVNYINITPIQFQQTLKKRFWLSYFQYSDDGNCFYDG